LRINSFGSGARFDWLLRGAMLVVAVVVDCRGAQWAAFKSPTHALHPAPCM